MIGTKTHGQADLEAQAMTDRELAALVERTPVDIKKRWESMTDDERVALRAQNELAKRGVIARERARKAEEAQSAQARQAALVEREIAAFKEQVQRHFVGTDAQFNQAWPSILADWQRANALTGPDAALRRKRMAGEYSI